MAEIAIFVVGWLFCFGLGWLFCFVLSRLRIPRRLSSWRNPMKRGLIEAAEIAERVAESAWMRTGESPSQRAARNKAATEIAEAIRARASSLPDEDGWLPIETAPKDGREVLLWASGEGVYIGHYDISQWWTDAEFANDATRFAPPRCSPTHWRPLPPSPSSGG